MLLGLAAVFAISTAEARAQSPGQRSNNIVYMDGNDYYLHTVASGETLYSLARLYNVSLEQIERDNPGLDEDSLKAGQTIKIICREIPDNKMSARKEARTFSIHTIVAGDTTYSIAKRYGISIETLIEDNPGLDPAVLKAGNELKIRKTGIGATDEKQIASQINDYTATLNEVSDIHVFYVVRQGDTVYSLSKSFGVTQSDIEGANDLSDGLKAGAIIKIPATEQGRDIAGRLDKDLLTVPVADTVSTGPILFPNTGTITNTDGRNNLSPLKSFEYHGNMNVSLLLPFSDVNNVTNNNFVDFYRGVLLALEDLKSKGYSMTVNVYDTQRSAEQIGNITRDAEFLSSDLIIGPVYEDELKEVIDAALYMGIPLVSPLASTEGDYGTSMFHMAPDPSHRYDKLKTLFTADKNIIFVTSDKTDRELESEMNAVAEGKPVRYIKLSGGKLAKTEVERVLSSTYDNIFVVLPNDEEEVNQILGTIASVYNNNLARSKKMAPIQVIGTSRWSRYESISRSTFFKLNITYITTYFADRNNPVVNQFDTRYISAYSEIPSLYAYRGYDAMMLFGQGLIMRSGLPLIDKLNDLTAPLQVGYRFYKEDNGDNINRNWPMVCYKNDNTIEIK